MCFDQQGLILYGLLQKTDVSSVSPSSEQHDHAEIFFSNLFSNVK